MKGSQSTPAFDVADSESKYSQSGQLRVRSATQPLLKKEDLEEKVLRLAAATPALAYPGISQNINSFRKSLSQAQPNIDPNVGEEVLESNALLENRLTPQLIVAVMQGLIGPFLFGYNLGVLNIPQKMMMEHCCGHVLSDNEFALFNTVLAVGGMIGSFGGAFVGDLIGRKNTMLLNDLIFVINGGLFFLASQIHSYGLILAIRFIIGLSGGVAILSVGPMYMGEISPPALRGVIGTMFQVMWVVGDLISKGAALGLGTQKYWGYLVGIIPAIPPLIQLLTFSTFPESPKWYYMKGRKDEALGALKRLRSSKKAALAEIETYGSGGDAGEEKDGAFISAICTMKNVRWAWLIGVTVMLTQQMCGINAVMLYSTDILKSAKLSFDEKYGTIMISVVSLMSVFCAIPITAALGRKPQVITSALGVGLCCIGLAVGMFETKHSKDEAWGILYLIFCLAYCFFFQIGLGPMPWVVGSEVSPTSHRSLVTSSASLVNWVCTLILSQFTKTLFDNLKYGTWILFAGFCAFGASFMFLFAPETKGLTEQEIQLLLLGKSKDETMTAALLHENREFGNDQWQLPSTKPAGRVSINSPGASKGKR